MNLFLALEGSVWVKDPRKTLMKLTTGLNFTAIIIKFIPQNNTNWLDQWFSTFLSSRHINWV